MTLGAGENEVGIGTALNIRADSGLYRIVIITGNLLKLVNSYEAGLVRLIQIRENLIQRSPFPWHMFHPATIYPSWS